MYTKQNLSDSLAHEMNVIRHLFSKIPEGTMGYRPSEGQRSTLELLQYLSVLAPAAIKTVIEGDTKVWGAYDEKSKTVTAENFVSVFTESEAEARALLESIDDATLAEEVNIYQMGTKSKGAYFVDTILKWLPAYKMQLFLYIKASGNTAIGTSNLWGGFDMPAK